MKRLLALSLAVNCALGMAVVLFRGIDPVQAARSAAPLGNGDVDGDGAYGINDAVYLLTWLFQGGPAPLPIEGSSTLAGMLPATGETRCYDPDGSVVPCSRAKCAGQDGAYQAGCPREGRFTDNGDGTVTDSCTGLMWQRSTADMDGDGQINAFDVTSQCGALAYCEGLTLAGHDDWRLPNVLELMSLVDFGRSRPAIDPLFEIAEQNPCYHTSNVLLGGPAPGQFAVDFSVGLTFGGGGLPCFVRAVRTAR